jgi:hypothetical protein
MTHITTARLALKGSFRTHFRVMGWVLLGVRADHSSSDGDLPKTSSSLQEVNPFAFASGEDATKLGTGHKGVGRRSTPNNSTE